MFIDRSVNQIVYLGNNKTYYTNKEIEYSFMKKVLSQKLGQKNFSKEENSKEMFLIAFYYKEGTIL
jgi:hypothetical protein